MKRHAILPLAAIAALAVGISSQSALAADAANTGGTQAGQARSGQENPGQSGTQESGKQQQSMDEQTASAQRATTRAYGASNEIRTANGIRFACTGVGKESRDNPKWNGLSTKIVYAAPDGAYLAGITTRISRAGTQGQSQGQEQQQEQEVIFSQWCDAPWLLVGLEPGTYQVTSISEDRQGQAHKETTQIEVGRQSRTEKIVRFPRDPS